MLESKTKLLPLRRFVIEDGYSKEYLSQLVQRKKLKARKVGRNYYTTLEWFEEYLEEYSHDSKSTQIKKNLYRVLGYSEPAPKIEPIKRDRNTKLTPNQEVSFLLPPNNKQVNNKLAYIKYILAGTLVVVVFWFMLSMYLSNQALVSDNGRVAGTSEASSASSLRASTTIENKGELEDVYLNYKDSLYRIDNSVSSSGKDVYMMEEVK